ncbi:F-box domain-containing protein [Caenorhabditis elegans]|uniref:F-box domain-containing protein n=1 Tax=Caenorhabditis elegans TaxID=6239 RepID=O18004_CAEEL|nr:F-box domain-containing protein [Caenorhabditis elegans]CAB07270.1 F-box domain-containing protein [Caenorhabditis elegans]|eukprot:NP_499389.1 F-box B protein [Caenorhabditis elegans]
MAGFPILRLPSKPLRLLFQTMDVYYLVSISFNSKFAKSIVESLNLRANNIILTMSTIISIDVQLNTLESLSFKVSEIGLRKFLDHILDIFHQQKVSQLTISSYDYQSIIEEFDSLNIETLHFTSPYMDTFHGNLLKRCSWNFDELLLSCFSPRVQDFQAVTCCNFKNIMIKQDESIKLEDLLVSNISEILMHTLLPLTDICLFLKHWINGSNQWLEILIMYAQNGSNLDEFTTIALNGIDYQKPPTDGKLDDFEVFNIRRKDGTAATITLFNSPRYPKYVKLNVCS